uniref:Uncharacterized protein n=1 Tax=Cannabis sativa TaxID=3483 RepID=A0A803PG78_CANSA
MREIYLNSSSQHSIARDAEAAQLLLVGSTPNYRNTLFDQLIQDQRDNSFSKVLGQNYGKPSKDSRDSSFRKDLTFLYNMPYGGDSPFTSADIKYSKVKPKHLSVAGKVEIQLNVNIPVDTELVEPLQEGCIWRQARGVATIVSEIEDVAGSSEKVGSAQKWYDELDTLVFTSPESESVDEDEDTTSVIKFADDKVHIITAVNTSPGTSEVIITAVLYLRLRRSPDQSNDNQEKLRCEDSGFIELKQKWKDGKRWMHSVLVEIK